ncbi:hypothetical protein [Leifsonia poae]|uniref:hypothetical protein n=1 Tax=Leifsonia poae TaxID=110933 RepID=UPI003D675140
MSKQTIASIVVVAVGLVLCVFAASSLYDNGAQADSNGTSGVLDPVMVGALIIGMISACVGAVLLAYSVSKQHNRRHRSSGEE